MRILFVVPPLTGHINPTIAVARELQGRGHGVAWVGHPAALTRLLPSDANIFALDDTVPTDLSAMRAEQAKASRGLRAFKFLWEDFFIPLAKASVPGVREAMDNFDPHLVVVDQQALAGAIVCRERNIPWAMSATTSAGVVDPFEGLPKIREWLDNQFDELQSSFGLTPVTNPDRSPICNLVFSSQLLVGAAAKALPDTVHFVGPAVDVHARRPVDFPWEALTADHIVYASLGTVNHDRGERFYPTLFEAVASKPVQVVLTAPESYQHLAPSNVILRPYVPQLALLKRVQAVVSHAGHNTVCETLMNGVPLVMTPIKDDQPIVAQQVVDAGAGIRLRFGRLTPDTLWSAIEQVLMQPNYTVAAKALQHSFQRAGGAPAAAQILESLV
jgi:MGT family glycosyltransferase